MDELKHRQSSHDATTNAKINCLLWWFLKVNYLCLNMLVNWKDSKVKRQHNLSANVVGNHGDKKK